MGSLTTNLQRATRYGDVNCQKSLGVFGNFLSMITTLVAAAAWSAACYKNLPRALFGVTMEWSHGAGVLCLVFGTLVKVPDALGNLLIRTPEKRWKEQVGPIADLADYLDLEE